MNLAQFLLSYFASKNVFFVGVFLCWGQDEIRDILRSSPSYGIRTKIYSINDIGVIGPSDIKREGIALDINCPESDDIIQYVSNARAFNERISWLLIDSEPFNQTKMDVTLNEVNVLPNSDLVWYSSDAFYDVYRIKQDLPLIKTELRVSSESSRQELSYYWDNRPTTVTRRKNLQNVYIPSTRLISRPQHFKGWDSMENRQTDTFPKFSYPLVLVLCEDLKCRYNFYQVDDYGVNKNGTYNGMMGLLQQAKIEIGGTSVFIREDRWSIIHYSAETYYLRALFVFRQPTQSSVSNVFLLPFSRGVWLASITIFLLIGALIALFSRQLIGIDPQLNTLTAFEAISFTVGFVCQQGFHLSPTPASIRLVMFVTLVSSLFIFTSYSAKIVAILQTPSNHIQTIDDLAHSPIAVGVTDLTYKTTYFAESNNPAVQVLYKHKLQPQGDKAYLSVTEGIARMRKSFYAFQVEAPSGYDVITNTFTEQEKCKLKEIEAFRLPMVCIPIRKYSGYKELFAVRLRWQREIGIITRVRRIWLAQKPTCVAMGSDFVTVGITDCLPAFMILIYGGLLALLFLILEIVIKNFQEHKVCGKMGKFHVK